MSFAGLGQNSTCEKLDGVSQPLRAILHIDLDCFYAQVEIVRLNLPVTAPLVVVQWGSVLAVSYAARVYGIKRGDNVTDVRRKSGTELVHVVSVETIGPTSTQTVVPDTSGTELAEKARGLKESEKVSLSRYRDASANVFSVVASLVGKFERASIDECFVDVTDQAAARIRKARTQGEDINCVNSQQTDCGGFAVPALPPDTIVIGDKIDTGAMQDRLLLVASQIASEIRSAVWEQCKFTCSAGIAMNKVLAKFASAANKPNRQTLAPIGSVYGLLTDTPLKKIRGCGGKISSSLAVLGYATAGDVRDRMTVEDLERAVGAQNASFVWNVVRGRDFSEVVSRELVKTVLAAKNFDLSHSVENVVPWLKILSAEIVERVTFEEVSHNRFARTLTLSARVCLCSSRSMTNVSRTNRMPGETVVNREDTIVDVATAMLKKVLDGSTYRLPISFVGLTAGSFTTRASSQSSIASFLRKDTNGKNKNVRQPQPDVNTARGMKSHGPHVREENVSSTEPNKVKAKKSSVQKTRDISSYCTRTVASEDGKYSTSGQINVKRRELLLRRTAATLSSSSTSQICSEETSAAKKKRVDGPINYFFKS